MGEQVVVQVVLRRRAADSGTFYYAKKLGAIAPPPLTYAPGTHSQQNPTKAQVILKQTPALRELSITQ